MKWFNNLKISIKLLAGFIMVALIAGVVGVIGIIELNNTDTGFSNLFKNYGVGLGDTADIATYYQKIRVNYRDIIIDKGSPDRAKYVNNINDLNKKIADALAKAKDTIQSDEGEQAYNDIQTALNNFAPTQEKIIQLALDNHEDQAAVLLRQSLPYATAIDTAVTKLETTKRDHGHTASDNYSKNARRTVWLMVSVIIGAMVLAIGLGFLISGSLSKPLKKVVEMIQEMSKGHLGNRLNIQRDDEIGIMAKSMDEFADDLQKNVIGTMQKIAAGDVNMDVQPKDDKDEISPALKKTIQTIRELINDMTALIKDTQEGKLNTRGNAAAYLGGWGTIVGGINNLIDTLVGHIDSMPCPVVIIDKDFNIVYMNKNGADLLSATPKQIIGTKCYESFKTTDCKTANCACARAMQQGQKISRETDAHPNGMNLDILYTGIPLKDENNNVIGALELVVDQTLVMNAARKAEKQAQYQNIETAKLLANIEDLAQGKLQCHAKTEPTDEDTKAIGEMFSNIYQTFAESVEAMSSYVEETAKVLTEMSKGNLDLEINGDYKGDFVQIKSTVNLIINSLNEVLGEINNASEQVASGARQVSNSAQALSQGSTEQASALEELTASMEEISTQTQLNATNADQANELALAATEGAIKGNEQMQDMLRAMEDINESSGNISKIIKVIDEIAFQTNILALNAAVEAARAGQHGKGFAVVAEEVRNLAARSANAAKETTALIEGSIKKVEGGTKIASDTAAALNQIVEGVTKATNLVGEIATASNEQAIGIKQMNQGIMQVSDVVQMNSATSEESAAASEELSSQAQLLKEHVNRFKLKKTSGSYYKELNNLNPQVLRMIEDLSQKKKMSIDDLNQGFAEAASTGMPKISLSDQEFGKY